MASLHTSEFQFAFIFFAKFNELNHYRFHHVVVPNQNQEGNANYEYNGADIVLDEYFLQIKMSDYLRTNGAAQSRVIRPPYFRFRIYNRATPPTNNGQLDYLKLHSNDPLKKVYYVAPCFGRNNSHLPTNANFWCNNFYRAAAANLWDYAIFIDVSSINNAWIDHSDNHHICYKRNGNAYYFSEEHEIKMITPAIESDEDLIRRASLNRNTIETIIMLRIRDIQDFAGNDFFEINRIRTENLNLFDLQYIYLTYFNTFWLPLLVPSKEILKLKLNTLNNLE